MTNILDIIYDYSKRFKLLDEDAFNKIMDELIKLNNFQDVSFEIDSNKNPFIRDLGVLIGKDIFIYPKNIMSRIKHERYKIDSPLEETLPLFEKYLRMNTEMLLTCTHEIEHAIQDRMMRENNDDTLEKKLVRIEDKYLRNTEDKLEFKNIFEKCIFLIPSYFEYKKLELGYSRNYDISLMERLANLNSYEKIKKMLELIKDELTDLLTLMDQVILSTQMETYDSKWGPTLLFFDNLDSYDEDISIYESLDLPYEDRIKFGLNLTDEEFHNNKQLLLKIKGR